jgi:hypothetical protein
MDYTELAEELTERFTPYAFRCDCKGAHSECASARNDASAQAQAYTIRRIALYLTNKGAS